MRITATRSRNLYLPTHLHRVGYLVVAVDVIGLLVVTLVVRAFTNDGVAVNELLERIDTTGRLELVLVDRGTNVRSARRTSLQHGRGVERVGGRTPSSTLRSSHHAWKAEADHGCQRAFIAVSVLAHGRWAKSCGDTLNSASLFPHVKSPAKTDPLPHQKPPDEEADIMPYSLVEWLRGACPRGSDRGTRRTPGPGLDAPGKSACGVVVA